MDVWECNGTFTVTIGDVATIIAACETGDFRITIKNVGTGTITIAPTGLNTIDGVNSSQALGPKRAKTLKIDQLGTGLVTESSNGDFDAGTKMVFFQASAPVGWTQDMAHNDKALRVVSTAGGGSAGTHNLSTPPSTEHTHTGPSHNHDMGLHTHEAPAHTHDLSLHTHAGPNHNHSYSAVIAHTHEFTTSDNGLHDHSFSENATDSTVRNTVKGNTNGVPTGTVTSSMNGIHNHSGTTASEGSISANTTADGTGATGTPSNNNSGSAGGSATGTPSTNNTSAAGTGATGSTTPTAFSPKYIDVIVAVKDAA